MRLPLGVHRLVDTLPWRVATRLRTYFPPPLGHYFVISSNPLIILIPEDFSDNAQVWQFLFSDLATTRVHFLCYVRGAVECSSAYGEQTVQILRDHKAQISFAQFYLSCE